MKKHIILIILTILFLGFTPGCDQDDILEITPKTILVDEQVFSSKDLVLSVLADLYDRMPDFASIAGNTNNFLLFDELMYSGFGDDLNLWSTYAWNFQNYWDWNYIRHLNDFIKKIDNATLEANDIKLFKAEARFLRAYAYFEFVKRMGGVPLITETYTYQDFQADPDALEFPRNKEYEIYDFISSEIDAIKNDLTGNGKVQTRATKWAALALKSRAMVYAGSLAKYNALMATPVTLPGGEVGIPASMADGYYQEALDAAEEIILNGGYSLYNANANKSDNYYEAVMKKGSPEVIMAKDFTKGKTHGFTFQNIVRALREDVAQASMNSVALGLVEAFEYQSDFDGTLKNKDALGDYIVYDKMTDIFNGKDSRLMGSVIVPGTTFKGKDVSIQAGVAIWDGGTGYTLSFSPTLNTLYTDGGVWVGQSGPRASDDYATSTGFNMRKYISDVAGEAILANGCTTWWLYFRYSEVLLNAGEAAFELDVPTKALNYINQVRARAGIQPLNSGTLTINRIINERRVELCFEDHRFYDLKRFRIAHQLLDGSSQTAEIWGLFPYRVIAPSNPAIHNKYIFVKKKTERTGLYKREFRIGNYYGQFSDAIISKNPSLVKNPNQD